MNEHEELFKRYIGKIVNRQPNLKIFKGISHLLVEGGRIASGKEESCSTTLVWCMYLGKIDISGAYSCSMHISA